MNICMAHRGWSSIAPENTLAAISLATNESRINAIEIDVHLTIDHVPVVIHDYTVNRTTNGIGFVNRLTYDQIRKLDAGSWFSVEYKGQKVPSLADVLEIVRGKCILNIDLKALGTNYTTIANKVVSVIEEYRMQRDVIITSFNSRLINYLNQQYNHKFLKGLIVISKPYYLQGLLEQIGANVVSMQYISLIDREAMWMKDNKYMIIAWTVNSSEHIKKIMEQYPNCIVCTDYPQRMFPFMQIDHPFPF